MLRRSKRLRGNTQVAPILAEGISQKSAFFVFQSLPNKLTLNRYGIVLSRKLLKKATDRNRKRRQIYAAIQEIEKENLIAQKGGSDIVILVRHAALPLTYEGLKKELLELLKI